jgi:hypothetical protein
MVNNRMNVVVRQFRDLADYDGIFEICASNVRIPKDEFNQPRLAWVTLLENIQVLVRAIVRVRTTQPL